MLDIKMWQPVETEPLQQRLFGSDSTSHATRRTLEALNSNIVRSRPAVTAEQVEAVRSLAIRFPNFSEYISWLADSLQFSCSCDMPVMIPPHVLVGPPGLGKSFIVGHVAKAMGMHQTRINIPDISANFVISGSTSTWHGGKPGLISRSLEAGPVPWIVFDELDKCPKSNNHAVEPTLLSMLEPSTAIAFRDENLELGLDIRPLVFSFTANTLEGIEPALLSRLEVRQIHAPTPAQMPALVKSIDQQLREEDPRIDTAFEKLPARSIKCFEAIPARDVKQHLRRAYSHACRRFQGTRLQLRPQDLMVTERPACKEKPPRGIGFHAAFN